MLPDAKYVLIRKINGFYNLEDEYGLIANEIDLEEAFREIRDREADEGFIQASSEISELEF